MTPKVRDNLIIFVSQCMQILLRFFSFLNFFANCAMSSLLQGYRRNRAVTRITEQLSSEACQSSAFINIQKCLTLSIGVPCTSLLPSKPPVLLSCSTFTSWLTCWWLRVGQCCVIFWEGIVFRFRVKERNATLVSSAESSSTVGRKKIIV